MKQLKRIALIMFVLGLTCNISGEKAFAEDIVVQQEADKTSILEPEIVPVTEESTDDSVQEGVWEYIGISTDLKSPQYNGTKDIVITPEVSGDTEGLQYKYVWQKDNWSKWGVLKQFSDESSQKWTPSAGPGTYKLYVDIKDTKGEVRTMVISYTIKSLEWSYNGINISPEKVQKAGDEITISPNVTGMTENLEYKYVWQTNNWKSWGVIQDFSNDSEMTWKTPSKTGIYTVYVDIREPNGKAVTKTYTYYLEENAWEHQGVHLDADETEVIYEKIPVSAIIGGSDANLQYKFVWQKDNWAKWGVIQNFSTTNQAIWCPTEVGTYTIYVDVKDKYGLTITKTINYEIEPLPWSFEGIECSNNGKYLKGDTVQITAKVSGDTEGLQYKFVWQRNNWSPWGVLQSFSEDDTAELPLDAAGTYYLYVDVKDPRGVSFNYDPVQIVVYKEKTVTLSKSSISPGDTVSIDFLTNDDGTRYSYKYVYQKNNWSTWGVLQDFCAETSVEWTPDKSGNYTIYVDEKDNITGEVVTYTTTLKVQSSAERIQAVLNVARSQIGVSGGIKYEDALLAMGGELCIGRGYWCGNFVWWCFKEAGLSEVLCNRSLDVYPSHMANYYKQRGQFSYSDPQPGDLAFFYWVQLPGETADITHVAIIESVTSTTITTIEGNMSNKVKRFTWSRSNSHLRGYAHLDY